MRKVAPTDSTERQKRPSPTVHGWAAYSALLRAIRCALHSLFTIWVGYLGSRFPAHFQFTTSSQKCNSGAVVLRMQVLTRESNWHAIFVLVGLRSWKCSSLEISRIHIAVIVCGMKELGLDSKQKSYWNKTSSTDNGPSCKNIIEQMVTVATWYANVELNSALIAENNMIWMAFLFVRVTNLSLRNVVGARNG